MAASIVAGFGAEAFGPAFETGVLELESVGANESSSGGGLIESRSGGGVINSGGGVIESRSGGGVMDSRSGDGVRDSAFGLEPVFVRAEVDSPATTRPHGGGRRDSITSSGNDATKPKRHKEKTPREIHDEVRSPSMRAMKDDRGASNQGVPELSIYEFGARPDADFCGAALFDIGSPTAYKVANYAYRRWIQTIGIDNALKLGDIFIFLEFAESPPKKV